MRRGFYKNPNSGSGFRRGFSRPRVSTFTGVPILGIYAFPSGTYALTIVGGRYYWITVQVTHQGNDPSGRTNRGHAPNKPTPMDPYEVLEISRSATKDGIKKAYWAKAKEYHPDMAPPEQKAFAEQKMKEINEAYNSLESL